MNARVHHASWRRKLRGRSRRGAAAGDAGDRVPFPISLQNAVPSTRISPGPEGQRLFEGENVAIEYRSAHNYFNACRRWLYRTGPPAGRRDARRRGGKGTFCFIPNSGHWSAWSGRSFSVPHSRTPGGFPPGVWRLSQDREVQAIMDRSCAASGRTSTRLLVVGQEHRVLRETG